jgi:hypothetical protein
MELKILTISIINYASIKKLNVSQIYNLRYEPNNNVIIN